MRYATIPAVALTALMTVSSGAAWAANDTDDEIIVGFATAKSGVLQAYDQPAERSAKIAIEEINQSGGLLGKQIGIVDADTKSDRNEGVKAGQAVVDAGADIVVATCDYDYGAPAASVAQEEGLISFFLCAEDVKAGIEGIGPYAFSPSILAAVQAAKIFADCKDFVDSPLLVSPDEAWRRWEALKEPPSLEELKLFVNSTFGPPGGELTMWHPPDHKASPPLLARLPAGPAREWAAKLNDMWIQLGRRVDSAVLAAPERTTLLPATHGFVVPGGRFRECYYWDSYWVVLGLLVAAHPAASRDCRRRLRGATETPSTLHTNAGLVQGRGRPREVHIIEHFVGGRVRLQD